jgi:hypothetical protein
MRRALKRAVFEEPRCNTCGLRMHLGSLQTNLYDPARPPIARFDCECGQAVTMRWYPVLRKVAAGHTEHAAWNVQCGPDPHASHGGTRPW